MNQLFFIFNKIPENGKKTNSWWSKMADHGSAPNLIGTFLTHLSFCYSQLEIIFGWNQFDLVLWIKPWS